MEILYLNQTMALVVYGIFKISWRCNYYYNSVNNRFDDSKKLLMGSDLLCITMERSYLYNYTGDFKITSFADDKDIILVVNDGGSTTA